MVTTVQQSASVGVISQSRDRRGLDNDSVADFNQNVASSDRPESSASEVNQPNIAVVRCQSQHNLRPLVPGQPINRECQRAAVLTCGPSVMQNLFSRSHRTKLYSLMFLYDLIRFTQADIHMELSKLGIIPKLLDFIRVNDVDEQLEVIGMRVLGLLAASDLRLKQLFSHHGGHTLLITLTRNDSATIRNQAKATLAIVTRGQKGPKMGRPRPASAPLNRRTGYPVDNTGPPQDVWEHIMRRWVEEDKVVKVLQKFMHD